MPRKTNHTTQSAFAEFYKINPTNITIWRQFVTSRSFNRFNFHDESTPKEKKVTYQGEITPHARRRLAKAIQLLVDITDVRYIINPVTKKRQKFSLAFWTLTLSAPQYFTSDSTIKKELLERFLRKMRKKGMRNYVWKAELQKNGNIHFHLLTDFFIEYTIIRDEWNNSQAKLGFIDEFELKHGHRNPNSTDVKSVKSIDNLAGYLSKYMLKPTEKNKQQKLSPVIDLQRKGKVWDCSLNLKIKNSNYDFLPDFLYDTLDMLEQQGDIRAIHEDFYKCYFLNKQQRELLIPDEFKISYNEFIAKVKSA